MMIRNLKVLGLALVAVFALSAVAASAAMAEGEITGPAETVKLTGTDVGPVEVTEEGETKKKSKLIFAAGEELQCHGHYTIGNVTTFTQTGGVEEHGWTDLPTPEVTVTPHYTTCRAIKGVQNLKATVTMNGCDFDLKIVNTKSAGVYNGAATLTCPTGHKIVVDVYSSNAETSQVCTYEFGEAENGGLTGGTVKTSGAGLLLGGKTTGITASRTGITCGGSTTTHAASLEAEVAVTAANELEEAQPIEVTD